MSISKQMNDKLNEQITAEFYASHLYLAMACMFESMSLKMMARVFRKQFDEERGHAMKILDYVLEQGGTVKLGAIDAPKQKWPSVVAAVEAALAHEKKVTGMINDLVALAEKEKDYASRSFLNWYIDEQVEEESSTGYLLDITKMAGDRLLHLESAVSHISK